MVLLPKRINRKNEQNCVLGTILSVVTISYRYHTNANIFSRLLLMEYFLTEKYIIVKLIRSEKNSKIKWVIQIIINKYVNIVMLYQNEYL